MYLIFDKVCVLATFWAIPVGHFFLQKHPVTLPQSYSDDD
jgi:hypothetical protein